LVQGANDTNNSTQREHIDNELSQIASEIERIWDDATFNGEKVFDSAGTMLGAAEFMLQVGADNNMAIDVVDELNGAVADVQSDVIDDLGDLHGHATHLEFEAAIAVADTMIDAVNGLRAGLGAIQNRLEFTIDNLNIASENLSAAESRVRDADMAQEMMRLTQANVLQQAATAMLAQANQAPQSVLQLLG
jgi:flagellin